MPQNEVKVSFTPQCLLCSWDGLCQFDGKVCSTGGLNPCKGINFRRANEDEEARRGNNASEK